jgi:hypothetical protein
MRDDARPLSLLTLVAILLCLVGCVLPTSGTYYAPTAAEGEATNHGDTYAPDMLRVKRGDGVIIDIWGNMLYDNPELDKSISITVMVHPGVVLHMPTDQIKILSTDGKEIAKYTRTSVGNNPGGSEELDAGASELDGDRIPGKYGDWYVFEYTFDNPKPDVFLVELPAMSYGGTDYPALEVTFTKTQGHWMQVYGP